MRQRDLVRSGGDLKLEFLSVGLYFLLRAGRIVRTVAWFLKAVVPVAVT